MSGGADLSDLIIIGFIAVVFVAGAITVFKFMRGGKRK
jgi:hypothetical protein